MTMIMRRHVRRFFWRHSSLLGVCLGAIVLYIMLLDLLIWAVHIKFG